MSLWSFPRDINHGTRLWGKEWLRNEIWIRQSWERWGQAFQECEGLWGISWPTKIILRLSECRNSTHYGLFLPSFQSHHSLSLTLDPEQVAYLGGWEWWQNCFPVTHWTISPNQLSYKSLTANAWSQMHYKNYNKCVQKESSEYSPLIMHKGMQQMFMSTWLRATPRQTFISFLRSKIPYRS